jgi:mannonate dehydratase
VKIGMGIHGAKRLNPNYLDYIRQIGATHVILFMPNGELLPSAKDGGVWSLEELKGLKKFYREKGLVVEGFENFDPKAYYKILLDEPGKQAQMDNLKKNIEHMGKAGIPIMGYNFSIGACAARPNKPVARGGALSPCYDNDTAPIYESLPLGWAWDTQVIDNPPEGKLPPVSLEEMLQRRDWFLDEILPVAEEYGVQMAAHPEDPPVPVLKNAARILVTPQAYEEMFERHPSKSTCVEFCQGTFAEMGVDIYEVIRSMASRNKISYVHFRNIKGTIPKYQEVFIDEGDVDMVKALSIYKECGYKGLLMPDHTPAINCADPNETGMAYAVGYIKGIMQALHIDIETAEDSE